MGKPRKKKKKTGQTKKRKTGRKKKKTTGEATQTIHEELEDVLMICQMERMIDSISAAGTFLICCLFMLFWMCRLGRGCY